MLFYNFRQDLQPKDAVSDSATTQDGKQFTYHKTGLAQKRSACLELKMPIDNKMGKLCLGNIARGTALQFVAVALMSIAAAYANNSTEEMFF